MKCPRCNETAHEPGARFCHSCGFDLTPGNAPVSERGQQYYDKKSEQKALDSANGIAPSSPPQFVLYALLLTAFTLASSLFLMLGFGSAFDGVLWPRLLFLGMVLLGFVGSLTYLIRYRKTKDKDDLLGQAVAFVIDSCIIIAGIVVSTLSVGIKLLLTGIVLLLLGFALVLRKNMTKEQ